MKKSATALVVGIVIGIIIGAIGYHVYYESRMSDAEKAVRELARSGKNMGR